MYIIKPIDIKLLLRARGQVDERRLAGAVARAIGDVHCPRPGGNVEDATATLLTEGRQEQAHQVVWPVKIDGDVVDELFGGLLVELERRYTSVSVDLRRGTCTEAAFGVLIEPTGPRSFAPALLTKMSTFPWDSRTYFVVNHPSLTRAICSRKGE